MAELATDAGAKIVGIVDVPAEFPDGWDLADNPPDGWMVEKLRGLLEAATAWVPKPETAEPLAELRRRAIRVMGGDLADATAAALRVLASERDPMQAVYVRGNLLMRPTRVRDRLNAGGIRPPLDALILRALDADWLRLRLAQVADFYVVIREDRTPVDPPLGICRSVIAAAPWHELPTLSGIIEAPTVLPDGTLIQTPGYNQATGLLFDPGETYFPPIPKKPTREQAEAALRTLSAPFKDFPFVDEPSRSVTLAAVLSALVRRGLRAAPLAAVRETLRALLSAWHRQFSDGRITIKAAIEAGASATELQAAMDAVAGERGGINPRRLGRFVARHEGRIEGGLRFVRDGEQDRALFWRAVGNEFPEFPEFFPALHASKIREKQTGNRSVLNLNSGKETQETHLTHPDPT